MCTIEETRFKIRGNKSYPITNIRIIRAQKENFITLST